MIKQDILAFLEELEGEYDSKNFGNEEEDRKEIAA